MASAVIDVPLGVHLEFPDQRPLDMDLSAAGCHTLVRELATALLERTNTGGRTKSRHTANFYCCAIRHLGRRLAERGFDGSVAQLSETLAFDYWRHAGTGYESATRVLLAHIERRNPGRLQPGVARQLNGVALNPSPKHQPRRSCSAGETQRLIDACRAAVTAAEDRMIAAEVLAMTGVDPTLGDWTAEANVAWALCHWGPQTSRELGPRLGEEPWRVDKTLRGTLSRLHDCLFPTMDAALAFRVLIGLETGICPEGVDGLKADCLEWAGAGRARISWFKARAAGAEAHVFDSRGPWSPGRLIERLLALSARARRFAPDPVPLFLFCDGAHHRLRRPAFWWDARDAFVARHGLLDDDGAPMHLRFGDLRSTYFARHDRHWNGALRIDPNHSARVEGDHYLAQTLILQPTVRDVSLPARRAQQRP